MIPKQVLHKIKGMQRDLSDSSFRSDFAFENKNIRITADTDNGLLSITNEKGTKEILEITIEGLLGTAVVNDVCILFSHKASIDEINKLTMSGDTYSLTNLFKGYLGFSLKHPIETLVDIESENIQKIYWVDGINQPRVINIKGNIDPNDPKQFDFVQEINSGSIEVEHSNISGVFPAGVIQYVFTYFNKFGAESAVVDVSPIYYIANEDKGAEPNTTINKSFKVSFNDLNKDWEYIRLYSIIRTSEDTTPEVKKVVDLSLPIDETELYFIDTGSSGEYVSPTDLLYKGGEVLSASTITAKDATLFLGDIEIKNNSILEDSIKDKFKNSSIDISFKVQEIPAKDIPLYGGEYNSEKSIGDFYQYSSQINKESFSIKHFKANETYRLGVQLQDIYGKWSDPIWIKDDKITFYPIYTETQYDRVLTGVVTEDEAAEIINTATPEDSFKYYCLAEDALLKSTLDGINIEDVQFNRGDFIQIQGYFKTMYYIGNIVDGSTTSLYTTVNPKDMEKDKEEPLYYSNIFGAKYSYYGTITLTSKNEETSEYTFSIKKNSTTGLPFDYTIEQSKITSNNNYFIPHWVNITKDDSKITRAYYSYPKFTLKNLPTLPEEYIKARPVIVYPEENDRECVCQGVLCPTVFNVGDRAENGPFVQSSWNWRFNPPTEADILEDPTDNSTLIKSGAWPEYRHFKPILGIGENLQSSGEEKFDYIYNGEFNTIYEDAIYETFTEEEPHLMSGITPPLLNNVEDSKDFVDTHKHRFFVDRSYLTLHSPELTFNNYGLDKDISKSKLRIIGMVPITASYSDALISGTPDYTEAGFTDLGFNNFNIKNYNKTFFGFRNFINGPLWRDTYKTSVSRDTSSNGDDKKYPYVVDYNIAYWNTSSRFTFNDHSTHPISKSRLYNFSFSNNSVFFDSYSNDNILKEIKLFNGENSFIKINNKYYQGSSVDKIVSNSVKKQIVAFANEFYDFYVNNSGQPLLQEGQKYYTKNQPFESLSIRSSFKVYNSKYEELNLKNTKEGNLSFSSYEPGVNSPNTVEIYINTTNSAHNTFTINDFYDRKYGFVISDNLHKDFDTNNALHNIQLTYNSTPHAILHVESLYLQGYLAQDNRVPIMEGYPFWSSESTKYTPINSLPNSKYGYLFLAELYREVDELSRFGGTSEYALQNNLWLPAGRAVNIGEAITWEEGDTYYQRYDCVKTLPRNDQDLNGITSVLSFMCETRINLDGRYDNRTRVYEDGLTITEDNFNKLNPVYNQKNNFFNYRILDKDRFGINNFPNTIAWSKTKQSNSIIDNWLNINLVSTLDLDGNKGKVTALKVFNDNIIAFQTKGISQILFNTRAQISVSDGVPIEIANSGKVDGKRYLSDNIGCLNKHSICESPNGLYFIDDYNKSLYLFNGQFKNISEEKGFHSWFRNNCKLDIWNPKDFNNFVTYRDPINNELLIIGKDSCLVFNETLGEFSSFYSYNDVPYMFTLEDSNLMYKAGKLYEEHGGNDYCNFFGNKEDFYTEIVVNDNPSYNKLFSTLDLRADVLNNQNKLITPGLSKPFNSIKVDNEYQSATSSLSGNVMIPKFRTWRIQIPRIGKDRIRNNWARIRLTGNNTNKVRLHDIVVNYFI